MPLTELVPLLEDLSRSDKLLLLHHLVTELLKESGLVPLDAQDRVGRQGLYDSFEAAAVLAKALAEKKRQHMANKVRFTFTEVDQELGALSMLPYLPLILTYQNQSLSAAGLLDTGSSVNVLPYEMGLMLGAVWEHQRFSVPLGGNLAKFEARAVVVIANVERFPPVELAFAWTKDTNAPLILGHMNFFLAFDVCFYRSELKFEVSPRRA